MTALGRIKATGNEVECPCCGEHFRYFRAHKRPNRMCWTCGSLERHRALALFFERRPQLLWRGMRMLHVAPERALRPRLQAVPDIDYRHGDLTGQYGPERIDVTDLGFPDATFDAVICNHVLEHVPDDRRAMREIRRVLKPDGWALMLVPLRARDMTDEDPSVTDPAERLRRFGQADHVRLYGQDFFDRLNDAGFAVERFDLEEELDLTPAAIERFRLRSRGTVGSVHIASPDGQRR